MIIQSKFQSRCKKCGGPIGIGEDVIWEHGRQGVTHVLDVVCEKNIADRKDTPAAVKEKDYRMLPLAVLFAGIDLKKPTLRFKYNDSELKLTLTRGGVQPGSIAIIVAGEFMGCIRKNGEATGRLVIDKPLQDFLLDITVSKEKMIARAVEYAKMTNSCSFCGLTLTNDFSVLNGYGPICADKWGLPHALNGTADTVMPAGLTADQKAQFMKMLMEEE